MYIYKLLKISFETFSDWKRSDDLMKIKKFWLILWQFRLNGGCNSKGVRRSFTFHCGPPRGFWTPMHHPLGLSWPGEPYPAYTCVHGVVKTESEKSEKSHGLFLKKKINFLENHLADWAKILTRARAKKSPSNETNPTIFDLLEE